MKPALLILLAFVLAGCASTSGLSTNAPPPTSVIRLGLGNFFIERDSYKKPKPAKPKCKAWRIWRTSDACKQG